MVCLVISGDFQFHEITERIFAIFVLFSRNFQGQLRLDIVFTKSLDHFHAQTEPFFAGPPSLVALKCKLKLTWDVTKFTNCFQASSQHYLVDFVANIP